MAARHNFVGCFRAWQARNFSRVLRSSDLKVKRKDSDRQVVIYHTHVRLGGCMYRVRERQSDGRMYRREIEREREREGKWKEPASPCDLSALSLSLFRDRGRPCLGRNDCPIRELRSGGKIKRRSLATLKGRDVRLCVCMCTRIYTRAYTLHLSLAAISALIVRRQWRCIM